MILFIQIVHYAFQAYFILLMVRIISSWIPEVQRYRAMAYVNSMTDPYLNAFRSIVPAFGGIDFSPILAFFALYLLENFVIRLLIAFIR